MRRRTLIYEGIGFLLLLVASLLIFLSPKIIFSDYIESTPIISWNGQDTSTIGEDLFSNTFSWVGKIFAENVDLGEMIFLPFILSFIFIVVISLTHLILVIVKKKPLRLLNTLVFLACGFMFLLLTVVFFTRGLFIDALQFDQSAATPYTKGGLLFYISDLQTISTGGGYLVSIWDALMIYFALIIYAVGMVLTFVGLVYDALSIVSSASIHKKVKKERTKSPILTQPAATPKEIQASINNGPFIQQKDPTPSPIIPTQNNSQQPVLVQYISVPPAGGIDITPFAPGEKVNLDEISSNLGLAKKEPPKEMVKEEPAGLTPDDIRMIIRQELAIIPESNTAENNSPTVNEIRKIIEEEINKSIKKTPAVQIKRAMNIEENIQETPVEQVIEDAPKRKVGEINPNLPPHEKIIKIPFPNRMSNADALMKSNYNELKSELLSYGSKSRVSNSGDTFRLHTVTFCKITIGGKSLKLYLALNPEDYKDAPFPVGDAGHKGTYKDIPLVFKVKSDLSLKRAKQLIGDVMHKNNLRQGEITPHNHAGDLLSLVEE